MQRHLDQVGAGAVRGDKDVGVEGNGETENASGMLAWIKYIVKYYYSTSI